jgi:hypothetical protein
MVEGYVRISLGIVQCHEGETSAEHRGKSCSNELFPKLNLDVHVVAPAFLRVTPQVLCYLRYRAKYWVPLILATISGRYASYPSRRFSTRASDDRQRADAGACKDSPNFECS